MPPASSPDNLLLPADIKFEDGTPYSVNFDDIYFSRQDGVGESYYHFIKGNHLPSRFVSLSTEPFCIAETGFGTGLNFFLTVEQWQQFAPPTPTAKLHYISAEKHPIPPNLLRQLYTKHLPARLLPTAELLLSHYPPLLPGCYQLSISQTITLTLLFTDAAAGFSELAFSADAWFLDGFAPAKNPDLWSTELFKQIAEHSHNNTTFATFTAASSVRRGLIAAGFSVQKTKGFGRKRERLIGTITPYSLQANRNK